MSLRHAGEDLYDYRTELWIYSPLAGFPLVDVPERRGTGRLPPLSNRLGFTPADSVTSLSILLSSKKRSEARHQVSHRGTEVQKLTRRGYGDLNSRLLEGAQNFAPFTQILGARQSVEIHNHDDVEKAEPSVTQKSGETESFGEEPGLRRPAVVHVRVGGPNQVPPSEAHKLRQRLKLGSDRLELTRSGGHPRSVR